MDSRPMQLLSRLVSRVRRALLPTGGGGYVFLPAPSIRAQWVRFEWEGQILEVQADYGTPLYETVAEVVDYDCYQLRSLSPGVLNGTTLLDIGANIGVTTLCLAKYPGTRVISVEPDPRNCTLLESNVARNHASGVTVMRMAVAQVNGRATLVRPEAEGVGCRLVDGGGGSWHREPCIEVETIDLRTLLDSVPGPIGLAKIDCEGGEYAIVDQLTAAVAARLPRLTFEIHERGPGQNRQRVSSQLQALGYRLAWKADPFGRSSLTHLLATKVVLGP